MKFIVCPAFLATIIALTVHFLIVMPGQATALQAPANICGPEWGCGPV